MTGKKRDDVVLRYLSFALLGCFLLSMHSSLQAQQIIGIYETKAYVLWTAEEPVRSGDVLFLYQRDHLIGRVQVASKRGGLIVVRLLEGGPLDLNQEVLKEKKKKASLESIAFAFVGDIMLAGRVGRKIQQTGNYGYPFDHVKHIFQQADIVFGNLEVVFSGQIITQNRRVPGKGYVFKVPPSFGQALAAGRFTMISLANNHALDAGRKGLLDTLNALDRYGIRYVGAGRNFFSAYAMKTIEIKGRKIGFLAFTDLINKRGGRPTMTKPGVALLKGKEKFALELIRTAAAKADLLVVSVHWGIEGTTRPSWRQKQWARKFIEAGADMVIGHHPHRVQPVEVYKGKIIAYSLGNFVFDSPGHGSRKSTILLVALCNHKDLRFTKLPVFIAKAQPRLQSTHPLEEQWATLACQQTAE